MGKILLRNQHSLLFNKGDLRRGAFANAGGKEET